MEDEHDEQRAAQSAIYTVKLNRVLYAACALVSRIRDVDEASRDGWHQHDLTLLLLQAERVEHAVHRFDPAAPGLTLLRRESPELAEDRKGETA
jgi:uncharacterized protein YjhX (UPF0386 family)